MSNQKPLFVYFGHHKSASSWIGKIIRDVCFRLNLIDKTADSPDDFGGDLGKYVIENQVQFLAYINANFHYVQQLKDYRGFHVIRDPRDLFVSAYFSHLYSHPVEDNPSLAEHRRRLQPVSIDDGLLLEMEYSKKIIDDMLSWDYTVPNVLQLKMEALTQNPYEQFLNIFHFLDLIVEGPLDETQLFIIRAIRRSSRELGRPIRLHNRKLSLKDINEILDENAFSKKSGGRAPGQEDIKNHYRKGIAGDWKNYFKEEHINYIVEHYNSTLLILGYETDPDWAEDYLRVRKEPA